MERSSFFVPAIVVVTVGAFALWRRLGARSLSLLELCAAQAVVALALSAIFGAGTFEVMRLSCWWLFAVGPATWVVCAIAASRSKNDGRKRFVVASLVGLTLLDQGIGLDAFFYEPTALETNRHTIRTPKLTLPVRIAVLADVQFDQLGAYEKRVFARVLDEHPDLILLPGDFIDDDGPNRDRLIAETRKYLQEIHFEAPLGAFAVAGNHDSPGWQSIFEGTGVRAIDRTTHLDVAGADVALTALSLHDSFDGTLVVPQTSSFQIVLGHGPDFSLGNVDADLLVAGHTHGGQVQLPFVGPLVTLSRVPRAWASGVTQLKVARTLVVSRGAGMERGDAPRLRFLCRPEIVLIDLQPSCGLRNRCPSL